MLGITNRRQWEEHISSVTVREQWGDVEKIETKMMSGWYLARAQDEGPQVLKRCLLVGCHNHGLVVVHGKGGGTWQRKDQMPVQVGADWYGVAQNWGSGEMLGLRT